MSKGKHETGGGRWLIVALALHGSLLSTISYWVLAERDVAPQHSLTPGSAAPLDHSWAMELEVWEQTPTASARRLDSSDQMAPLATTTVPPSVAAFPSTNVPPRAVAALEASPPARDGSDGLIDELALIEPAPAAAFTDHEAEDLRPESTRKVPMDLGLTETSYLVVGPALGARVPASAASEKRSANLRVKETLDASLARGLIETDTLQVSSLEVAARNTLLDATRASLLQLTTPLVVRFTVTTAGAIESAEVIRGQGAPPMLASLVSALKARTLAVRSPRPIQYTFELAQSSRLRSGRTAGTGLSLGGLGIIEQGAPDSPKVELVPPKWRFERARNLSRDRTAFDQDPLRSIYVEQRIFETTVDPADLFANERHETRTKLLQSVVL